jgi:futalosine hydrolase
MRHNKTLLVVATPFEIAPLLQKIESEKTSFRECAGGLRVYHWGQQELHLLITGIGLPAAAFALGTTLAVNSYDRLVQAGVAGAYDRSLQLGQLTEVSCEQFGDLGIEQADGVFVPLHLTALLSPDAFPLVNGKLYNLHVPYGRGVSVVEGLSVNRVHGYQPSIEAIRTVFPQAQTESMEGAAFFWACLQSGQQAFRQFRAISNYVETRNRANWRLEDAVSTLSGFLYDYLSGTEW